MKCGLGNWNDISTQFVESKNPKECEEHYYSFYYKSREDFKPTHEDFIIKGQKFLGPNSISIVDIDERKSADNSMRVKNYAERREIELEEENRPFINAV